MNKNKFLIVTLVLAIMLMGVGYAAWSQSFNITAYAESGEIRVEVEFGSLDEQTEFQRVVITERDLETGASNQVVNHTLSGLGEEVLEHPNYPGFRHYGYRVNYVDLSILMPEDTDTGSESIRFLIDNAYPGFSVRSSFLLKNKGTYPVLLNCDPEAFKATDGTTSLAHALINAGYVSVVIAPNSSIKPDGDIIDITTPDNVINMTNISEYFVTITLSENMPNTFEFDGGTVSLENVILEYDLDFEFEIYQPSI